MLPHMQIHAHIHTYSKHVDRTSIHISELLICIKKEQKHKLNDSFKKKKMFTIETHYEAYILTQNISL